METFFFDPVKYQKLYNCSFYNISKIPVETRQNRVLGSVILLSYLIFNTLYCLVIYAMISSNYRQQPTYRLMILLGCIHLSGLQICGLVTSLLAIEGAVFCSHPSFIYVCGQIALSTWCASAMTSLILGFNRCCELYGGGVSQRLFGGYRIWIWVSFPLMYLMYCFWFTPPVAFSGVQMTWLFNPHASYFDDYGKVYHNDVHSTNNIILCSSESLLYVTLVALYWRATRMQSTEIKSSFKREKMIYLQVVLIGIIHFTASSVYVFIQFVHANFAITMVASTFYLLSQGFPSIIYLCVNRTIRNTVLGRLGLRRRHQSSIIAPSLEAKNVTLTKSSSTNSTSVGTQVDGDIRCEF